MNENWMNRAGALALLAALACSPAESEGASTDVEVESVPTGTARSTIDLSAGEYLCYLYGHFLALESSSMTALRILGPGRYEALGEQGAFSYDAATGAVSFTTGGLAGYSAHRKQSGRKPAIVFVRKELEAAGLQRIDLSDTWCYHESGSDA